MVSYTRIPLGLAVALSLVAVPNLRAQNPSSPSVPVKSSYQFPVAEEDFSSFFKRISADKPAVRKRQMDLLNERYDLSDRPDPNAKMSRGKPVQAGVRVKLPPGVSWDQLSAMSPEDIRSKGLFPAGFLPLPHPKNEEGGMVFPHFAIDEVKKQTGRDLARFDVDFDIPDHFLPEFPAGIYLTIRDIQRHLESQTARRIAVAADAIRTTTVQSDGGSPQRTS